MDAWPLRDVRAARDAIVSGALRGAALAALVRSIPDRERDVWTDELLAIEPPPPDMPDLPRGAVPYLPCGVDEILAMVRDVPVGPDDTLVDLGAGLGRVVILAHLLTGARAHGVELQPHLVVRARAIAAALALPAAVTFEEADATEVVLDASLAASIVFLYAPFNGAMLARAVDRLAELARRRRFTVCAVDLELHDLPWLAPRPSSSPRLAIYQAGWAR